MDYLEQRGEKTDDPGKYKKRHKEEHEPHPLISSKRGKVIRGDRHRGGGGCFFQWDVSNARCVCNNTRSLTWYSTQAILVRFYYEVRTRSVT